MPLRSHSRNAVRSRWHSRMLLLCRLHSLNTINGRLDWLNTVWLIWHCTKLVSANVPPEKLHPFMSLVMKLVLAKLEWLRSLLLSAASLILTSDQSDPGKRHCSNRQFMKLDCSILALSNAHCVNWHSLKIPPPM